MLNKKIRQCYMMIEKNTKIREGVVFTPLGANVTQNTLVAIGAKVLTYASNVEKEESFDMFGEFKT